ncbi:MAG: glycosyltransferase family 9 protein [Motiliproteus sp.]
MDVRRPMHHILIVRWDAKWGDAIVSSFFIPELKKQYPEAHITVLAPPFMSEYFTNYLEADRVLTLPKRPKYQQLKQVAAEIGHCDMAVHLSPRLRMKDLYFFNKLKTDSIAGMDDEVKAINLKLNKQSKGEHYADIYKNLLIQLGVEQPNCQYLVPRENRSQKNINNFLEGLSTPVVAINPYGSGSSRQFTPASIKLLINAINKLELNLTLCILLTPDKKQDVKNICSQFDNVIAYLETQSIYDSIEIIARANWVISVDTAIVHIATGLNKPTLALYNPDVENYNRWHPNNPKALSFNSEPETVPDINSISWPKLSNEIIKLFKINP